MRYNFIKLLQQFSHTLGKLLGKLFPGNLFMYTNANRKCAAKAPCPAQIVHVDAENELVGFAFYGWMSTRRRNSGELGRALADGLQAAELSDNVEK